MDIRRSPDPQTLAREAASFIADRIAAVISKRGCCHLALAGGGTPKATYVLLRDMAVDWSRLNIWFGDERCLPVGDAERNDILAGKALLEHVPIPAGQIHPMPAEQGAEVAARVYSGLLKGIDRLDIVLLGLGEDGHTASLFPGNAALSLNAPAVPVFHAPKPPPQRVSLSLNAIRQAGERIVLAAGPGKREPIAKIIAGATLPAAMVGDAVWFVDAAAAGSDVLQG